MKYTLLFLMLAPCALAQWIVNDPANTAVNTAIRANQVAQHLEVMRQWAEEIERLNRQLRMIEDQLGVQQRIRDFIGDPSAAGAQVVLRELGATDLARTYGDNLQAVRRLASAVESLRHTADGIYRQLDEKTTLGAGFVRQEQVYRRYAVVERQAGQFEQVVADADARSAAVQAEIAGTMQQLRISATQAETDKLNAKLAALNAQLAELATRRREAADRLQAAHVLNENQAAKERQDLLERQLAEERQTLDVVNAWQKSLRLTPGNYSRP
jgi:hypothetical protein